MTGRTRIAVFAGAVVLFGAAGLLSWNQSGQTVRADGRLPAEPGPLDGMVFEGMLGPDGQPKDVSDTFVFEGGTFVSKECELRCDYPARPYTAARVGDAWQFESTTRCPYKDATIVWRGSVSGDRIEGMATWTIRRWYWTVTRDFAFEAQLQQSTASARYE